MHLFPLNTNPGKHNMQFVADVHDIQPIEQFVQEPDAPKEKPTKQEVH